jgi:hypothetical protein
MRSRFRTSDGSISRQSLLSTAFFCAVLLGFLSVAPPALAQLPYATGESEVDPQTRNRFWQGQVGMRSTFVTDPGFDAFALDNALTSFSVGVSRTILSQDTFSLAPGLFWDYGGRSASARGDATSLVTHRLGLGLEGRYHFAPWAYGLVRVTPGMIHQRAVLEDPLAAAPYVASAWTFAVDASAGAAFLIGPHRSTSVSPLRWWLAAEGGYGYAGTASLAMHPDVGSDDPRRTGSLDLGRLALGGGFFRIYGSMTF